MDFQVRACNARVLTQRNKDAKKTRMGIFCFGILFVVFWLVFPLRLSVLSDSGRENRSGGIHTKMQRKPDNFYATVGYVQRSRSQSQTPTPHRLHPAFRKRRHLQGTAERTMHAWRFDARSDGFRGR